MKEIKLNNNLAECCADFFAALRKNQDKLNTDHLAFLENSIMQFLEDECEDRANDVYTTFFDINKLNNTQGKPFADLLDKLREYEQKISIINDQHRDHYVHSVNVFVLGLAIYGKNSLLRNRFKSKYLSRDEVCLFRSDYEEFLFRWGVAALFHDIGYPVEIMSNQLNEFVKFILGDKRKMEITRPYIGFLNFSLLNRIDISDKARDSVRGTLDRYTAYGNIDLTNPLNLISAHIASDYKFDNISFKDINDDMENYLGKMQKNGFVDHGFYSAIIVLKWYGEMLDSNGLQMSTLYYSILDAASAILLHNYYEKTLLKRFKAPKMQAKSSPLAYLLAFCDAAQEWNRAAYGKTSKLQNCVDSYKINIGAFDISFCYDTNNGEINQMFINKKKDLFNKLFDEHDIFPDGVNVNATTITKEFIANIKNDTYTPSVRPIIDRIEILAREINNRYNERERAKGKPENATEWENLSDTLKYSNIRSARDIISKLGIVKCTTEDNGTKPLERFTEEEVEILARYEHDQWVAERIRTGWVYGEVKNKEKKITPDLVPYDMLDEEEKEKDRNPARDIIDLLDIIGLKVYRE